MLNDSLEDKQLRLQQFLASINLNVDYPDYSSYDYWNRRYLAEKGKSYDWYIQNTNLNILGCKLMKVYDLFY